TSRPGPSTTPHSHSGWTNNRGPVKGAARSHRLLWVVSARVMTVAHGLGRGRGAELTPGRGRASRLRDGRPRVDGDGHGPAAGDRRRAMAGTAGPRLTARFLGKF